MDTELQYIELAKVLGPAAIAVLGTLAGGFVGHKYAKVQTRTSKSIEFTERRIREFYSPMVGCLQRVRALADLRSEISAGASTAWKKICDEHSRPFVDHEEYFAPFKAAIEFDNQQIYEEILPTYNQMVQIFTDNFWLASGAVQSEYAELCRFVELWNRYRDRTIPMEVLDEIGHSESRLSRLYTLLESDLKNLRDIISYKKSP
jgi:hypothetical protein